jgi:hypothetical protein
MLFFPFVIHNIGPIKAIIDIRIQVDFESLNSFVVIRNIALKVVIIDQKHKTINDNINICFIQLFNLVRFFQIIANGLV